MTSLITYGIGMKVKLPDTHLARGLAALEGEVADIRISVGTGRATLMDVERHAVVCSEGLDSIQERVMKLGDNMPPQESLEYARRISDARDRLNALYSMDDLERSLAVAVR